MCVLTAVFISSLTRVLTNLYVYALNARLLLCPTTLSYDWQMGSVPLVTKMTDPRNCLSLLLILSLFSLGILAVCKTKVSDRYLPDCAIHAECIGES